MSKFFINRPIFAAVLAILIIVAGLVTLGILPISKYPDISPPTVTVTATYPGANAETIAETVGVPIEQQINGVEGMMYMSSVSSSSGVYTLTITFEVGTDIDMATVLVQNRVNIATSTLPEDVKRLGVTTEKTSTNIVLIITMFSPDGSQSDLYLSNYARLNVVDQLKRLDGVGSVSLFGAEDYSMRIWLDPEVLYARGLTPIDVYNAIKEQNTLVSAGKIGEEPTTKPEDFQYTLDLQGRFDDVAGFEEIVVKSLGRGQVLRLKDIATIELGSKYYYTEAALNGGKPSPSIAIYQLPGANALTLAQAVRDKMAELDKTFPKGIDYQVTLDTTEFVNASIDEVYKTLFEAIILVLIVIMIFLQDWRAVIIPTVTIPVSLIGTFAMMELLGFSINTLTLFGIVLAIGIVVDDAIIVVENVSRHIEDGLSPKEATLVAMKEVSGPVVGVVLVLLAVFVPTAFIGGITGELYKQFALTIATATVLSGLNALTLSPALCALILRPKNKKEGNFFIYRYFNKGFDKLTHGYVRLVTTMIRRSIVTFIVFAALSAAAIWGFVTWPSSFVPNEDEGYFMVAVKLPDGASFGRTRAVLQEAGKILDSIDGVKDYLTITGMSLLDNGNTSNGGTIFVMLEPWKDRKTAELSIKSIIGKFAKNSEYIEEAQILPFAPPPIPGLGTTGGFEFMLLDKNNLGMTELQKMADEICVDGNTQKGLHGLNTSIRANIPQINLEIDRDQIRMHNVSLSTVFNTLSFYLAGAYVNDFVKFGRVYQVKIQASQNSRATVSDIMRLSVKNSDGKTVPFSVILKATDVLGPELVTRYNMYDAATINGESAPGYSTGQGLAIMENMADDKLGNQFGYDWTSMAYQEKASSGTTTIIFALAILLVYLVLAAQYESWTSPFAVIMSVPIAILGVLLGCMALSLPISVYTQIGIVLLIALAAKNAILIVEFARDERAKGMSITDAAILAGRLRLRPILMTSFAFTLGVAPLVTSTGAGAASRVSLGVAVFAGMLINSTVGTMFIPNFYVLWQTIEEKIFKRKEK